jgi:transketolase
MTMREEFVAAAVATLEADASVVVVLADISADAFGAAALRFPDRVVNVGIREQLMVSVAGGLALAGMRPIVHTYAPFAVSRAFEQLKLDLTYQGVDAVVVTIGASYDVPTAGTTHFAPEDIALVGSLPGWHAHVPAHDDEVAPLLHRALEGGNHYLRLTERSVRRRPMMAPATANDRIVIAVGPTIAAVEQATRGWPATVLPMTTVRPFDAEALRRAIGQGTKAVDVVLVEPYLVGTSAYDVAEALKDIPHRLLCIGVQRRDLRRYGTVAEHDAEHGLDAASIRRAIEDFQRIPAGV